MEKKFDRSMFLGKFQEETREHLRVLNQDLLILENDSGNPKILEELEREVHTLKGSAKMMGYKVNDIPHLKLASQRRRLPDIVLHGDYDWDTLPSFHWPLEIDTTRRLAAWLESTWLEDCVLFQWVENWLERMYHHVTFFRNRKKLFSGPWMEYERAMKSTRPEQ